MFNGKCKIKIKKNTGITLVALVVTIVVLLILAGITINLILGPNSIFETARKAGEETNKAVENEQAAFGNITNYLTEQGWANGSGGNNGGSGENSGDTDVKITGITFPTSTVGVAIDGNITLKPNIEPEDASNKTLKWTSENQEIATVDENGVITPVKVGEATIKAEVTDKSEKYATCKVIVMEKGAIPYSWEELGKIAEAISNTATYKETTTTEISVEVDGNTKTLKVGDWTKIEGRRVRILGFNHDTLKSETAYGKATATGKAGISFEYLDCLMESTKMHSSDSNKDGWITKDLYKTLNTNGDAKYKALQSQGIPIKQVQKMYNAPVEGGDNTPKPSSDYLWLLSCSEIWGNSATSGCASGYSKAEEGKQYAFYANLNPKPKYNDSKNDNVKHYNSVGTSALDCWLRSPLYSGAIGFCRVDTNGYCSYGTASIGFGVAPGFSI